MSQDNEPEAPASEGVASISTESTPSEPSEKKPKGKSSPRPTRPTRPQLDPVVVQWRALTGQDLRGTPCASCKQGLWQIVEVEDDATPEGPMLEVQVYCQLLHAYQQQLLRHCGGNPSF